MRVAIAARELGGLTGAAAIVLEHARVLTAQGHTVEVFGEALDEGRVREAGGIPRKIRGRSLFGNLRRRLAFAKAFRRALGRGNYDLVIGNGDTLDQDALFLHNLVHLATELIPGESRKKVGSVGRLHAMVLRENAFRLCIANSNLMKHDIEARFGVPPSKVQAIHPGYDPHRFGVESGQALRAQGRRDLGIDDETPVVGLITSGNFRKRGVDVLIRAAALLSASRPDAFRVLVVGKDRDAPRYEELAAALGVGERLLFRTPIPQVERFFHAVDVLAHPAHIEEFGLVVLEAAACGVPVVTTTRTGAAEVLGDPNGLFIEDPSPEPLAKALAGLLWDSDRRARAGEESRRAVRDHTWEQYFTRLMAAYDAAGLLRGPPSP